MRKYNKGFKEEAVKLSDEVGVKQAASQFGIPYSTRRSMQPKPWQLLLVDIRNIYAQTPDNRNYGVGRNMLALEQNGVHVSRSSVRRAMKRSGLLKTPCRRANSLTKADAVAQKAENLIRRDFSASVPNQKWLTDITQISCLDGKLYIVAVLDCYNGEIVGLAMDGNMKKELCIRGFRSACQTQDACGMILHSDRGSQFTSAAFRKILSRYRAIQSMSSTGRCYDNARMESFFATLKKGKLYQLQTEKLPMGQVKSMVFRYIMTYYNRQRVYTANPGGLPPAMYRQAARGLAA
ncbi:MAG: IS3 family transposase [Oscillibacter sp.]|nr:IS3 family transposase [Oscillibacter sp.]MEA4993001.1 IS3 family transposase [Oscillibacter sp.]